MKFCFAWRESQGLLSPCFSLFLSCSLSFSLSLSHSLFTFSLSLSGCIKLISTLSSHCLQSIGARVSPALAPSWLRRVVFLAQYDSSPSALKVLPLQPVVPACRSPAPRSPSTSSVQMSWITNQPLEMTAVGWGFS